MASWYSFRYPRQNLCVVLEYVCDCWLKKLHNIDCCLLAIRIVVIIRDCIRRSGARSRVRRRGATRWRWRRARWTSGGARWRPRTRCTSPSPTWPTRPCISPPSRELRRTSTHHSSSLKWVSIKRTVDQKCRSLVWLRFIMLLVSWAWQCNHHGGPRPRNQATAGSTRLPLAASPKPLPNVSPN